MLDAVLCTNGRSVIQSNLEQRHLHQDHNYGLGQQGLGVVLAEPVKDPRKGVNSNIQVYSYPYCCTVDTVAQVYLEDLTSRST